MDLGSNCSEERVMVKVSSSMMRQDLAISMAVSSLSPVRTQNLMSALISVAMVSGSPS